MGGLTKLPLTERLQSAGTAAPNFLAAFELFISDYYKCLAGMTLDPRFSAVYDTVVSPYSHRPKGGESMELLLSEVVAVVMDLPRTKRAEVLYKLLIEPFARLDDMERRENSL